MTFLSQPVFLFPIQWADAIERSITLDLREEAVGFGAEYFTPTQTWTVNGWSFDLFLRGGADFLAWETFFDSQVGPLKGFWLPCPLRAGVFAAALSATQFKIASEGLSDTWQSRPDQFLFFTFPDGTQAAGQIQGVVDNGDGTETVTLTAALPQAPAAGTLLQRLHFCRLASDTETYEFSAENMGVVKLTVVELPNEYSAPLLGLRMILLFHFWAQAPVGQDWRYTSFAATVASGGKLYSPFPINFSGLTNVSDLSADELKLEAKPDAASPLNLFLPAPFTGTLFVEVLIVDLTAPDSQTLLFSGRVVSVEDEGSKLIATCQSRIGYLRTRKVPRYLKGQTCQNVLYDPRTCKLPRAFFETTITIFSMNNADLPPTLQCTFNFPEFAAKFQPDGYLVNGQIEAGVGTNYEARTILASRWNPVTGYLLLTLNEPFYRTAAGATAQIVAGCDHTAATCQAKFDNFTNFNGFVAIPDRNPTLKAVNANPVSQGGK